MSILSQPKSEKLNPQDSLIETKDTNKVIRIFIILTSGLTAAIVVNLLLVILSWQLATREKIYVQEENQIQIAEAKDPDFRTNQVIQDTVIDWLYLTWEWDASIPGSSNLDSGIRIKGSDHSQFKVPTRVYTGSYLLEVGFREKFLKQLSTLIPPSFYFGKLTSNVKIYYVSTPQRIDRQHYQIDVVMTRTDVGEYSERQETKINRRIYLRTIHPYRLVLGKDEPSTFRKQLQSLLKNGLLIYKIEPIK